MYCESRIFSTEYRDSPSHSHFFRYLKHQKGPFSKFFGTWRQKIFVILICDLPIYPIWFTKNFAPDICAAPSQLALRLLAKWPTVRDSDCNFSITKL